MSTLGKPISIAIETTCRAGAVALGAGDTLIEVLPFDASRRAATQLVSQLKDLAQRHGVEAQDIDELYVSVGPGSFTGTRVGVTVARTWVQVAKAARCVGVPTVSAVAENVRRLDGIANLAVVLDAGRGNMFTAFFRREQDLWAQAGESCLTTAAQWLADVPKPVHVLGEGLGYHNLTGEAVTILPEEYWLPQVESVWRVGRRLAKAGEFTAQVLLLPIYTGRPPVTLKQDARRTKA